MLIDLQLHSTYSDGFLTPTQLVKFLSAHKIKTAALTDHNTVGGIGEFKRACKKNNIKPLVGLELYARLGSRKFNLLWYNFDYKNPELHDFLRQTQIRRRNQIRRTIVKLKQRGLIINKEKILDKYNHYVPLNRLINDIWRLDVNRHTTARQLRNYKFYEDDIISFYFKNPRFGALSESYVDLEKILKLRRQINGQLVLNHPGKHNQLDKNFISALAKKGIDGIEIISPHHSIGSVMYAQRLARQFKLIVTGGSDFHRLEGNKMSIQNSYDYFKIDSKYLPGIKKIIG